MKNKLKRNKKGQFIRGGQFFSEDFASRRKEELMNALIFKDKQKNLPPFKEPKLPKNWGKMADGTEFVEQTGINENFVIGDIGFLEDNYVELDSINKSVKMHYKNEKDYDKARAEIIRQTTKPKKLSWYEWILVAFILWGFLVIISK